MIKKQKSAEELKPTSLTLQLPQHIVADFKLMEKNTKISVDDLCKKALLMFIATHNDYLGKRQ